MDPLILQKLQKALDTLITERVLALDSGEDSPGIKLSFVAPNKDFTAELGTEPTINCYLIGVNEDKARRQSEPPRTILNEAKTKRILLREPRFVDLSFMLTIWCKDKKGSAEIEHLILGYLISGLGRYDFMPQELLFDKDLDDSPYGVRFTLFGNENSEKVSGHMWQALGSTPKPSLMLSLSVPVAVHEAKEIPLIEEIERVLRKK